MLIVAFVLIVIRLIDCSIHEVAWKYRIGRISKLETFTKPKYFTIEMNDKEQFTVFITATKPLFEHRDALIIGYLAGFPKSKVKGSLIGLIFDGEVTFPNGTHYSIEPLSRFGRHAKSADLVIMNTRHLKPINRTLDYVHTNVSSRARRSIAPPSSPPIYSEWPENRSCCYMYFRSDVTLWNEIFKNEGQENDRITEMVILNLFHKTVDAANEIYRNVPFGHANRGEYKGFQLRIKRTKIMKPSDCGRDRLCEPFLDVLAFLTAHSKQDFSEYCLAYTFTARDFDGGTLGLAWAGKTESHNVGGICDRSASQDDYKGYNGGIVTMINYGTRVSRIMMELTFTHEVAHNLGAEHDPETGICSPSSRKGGNYLMFSKAMSTSEENSNKFSPCSLLDMGEIMVAMVESRIKHKPNCLEKCAGEFCGNRITEEGEECDCGFEEDCAKINDNCCEPADAPPERRCKLKANAACSRSQGQCCSQNCRFLPPINVCQREQEDDCLKEVTCNGKSAQCPTSSPSFFKENGLFCNGRTGLCKNGECSDSVCTLFGMQQCQIVGKLKTSDVDTKKKMCHIGCFNESNRRCIDTFDMSIPNFTRGFWLRKGSSCADNEGYCDIFDVCRAVYNEGPLLRLRKLIFSDQNIATVKKIAQIYWWAVLLVVLGLFIAMALLLKFCSVYTRSSNPYLEQMRPHRTLTIRRRTADGYYHQSAIAR